MKNTRTKWEGQNRSFKGDLRFGKLCEEVIRRFLMHYVDVDDVRDISNSNRGIKDDIDFEIVYRDGHTSTAELKSDMQAHKTGNIAYEELSHKNPGCFARTKADHIIYYLTETGVAYVLNPHKLRAFVAEMKADDRKAASLRVRPAKMGEGAFGYLIPIRVLLNNTDIVEATMMVGAITAEMIAAA